MRISFIIPCLSTAERYGKALGKVGPTTEPLGPAYIAAAIREKRKNDKITILDAAVENYGINEVKDYLIKEKPDVVGVTILTPMYLRAKETISLIRKTLPKAQIVVGGPHVTIFPKQTLEENQDVDYAVVGEGEHTFVELLDALDNKKSLGNILGLIYRLNDKILINPPRHFIKDLDQIPLPARDLLPMDKYRPAPTYYLQLPSHIVLTSRGCPFQCSYCSKVFGQTYRFHSIGRIMKEINILINDYNAKEIIFRDDTFTINKGHVRKLCKRIIDEGIHNKIRWTCMTRVNLVDLKLLKLMKKAGCWSIHYGVESGSQRLLDLIGKGIILSEVRNAVKWTKTVGIEVKAFFMIGLPTETEEETQGTIDFTKELDPDWIQVTITTPYPGTKLYDIAKKDGTLKSFKWEDYQTWVGWANKELVYTPKGRDSKELKILQKKAMRDFYFRPQFVLRQLKYLRSWDRTKTYLLGALALAKSMFDK